MEEGSGEVVISISRTGDLLDDITVLFAAGEIPRATSAAIGTLNISVGWAVD